MTIYIFTGPTLSAEDARKELDAIFLPPAAQGDVYRAALEQPAAIGIIDGYFDRVASVSHKEVLWAMSQGIHVFGAASMGALRAVELAPFGMAGVGAVFEAFQSGELQDDDEVAVAHASAEDGYRMTSEAMVNIRATLAAAAAAGVIQAGDQTTLVRLAKALFYPDRCYPILLARAAEAGLDPAAIEALRGFVHAHRVDRKREDALAMLREMCRRFAERVEPTWVSYTFERTDAWEHIRSTAERAREGVAPHLPRAVIEELKIAGALPGALQGAMARALAIEMARRQNRALHGAALEEAASGFRGDRGLFTSSDLKRWLADQEVGDFGRFLQGEGHVRWADTLFGQDATRMLPDHLRSTGEYAVLLARARDKERLLAAGAPEVPSDLGMTEAALTRWYFEERLCRPIPIDLAVWGRSRGFRDAAELRRAMIRELAYVRARSADPAGADGADARFSAP